MQKKIFVLLFLICMCFIYKVNADNCSLDGMSYAPGGGDDPFMKSVSPGYVNKRCRQVSEYKSSNTGCTITVQDRGCSNGKGQLTSLNSCTPGKFDYSEYDCKIPDIEIPDNEESYRCYRKKLANDEYDFKWTNKKPTGYVEVSEIKSESLCSNLSICVLSESDNNINPSYTCQGSITTDDVQNESLCKVDSNTFYEFRCTETFVADYAPMINGEKLTLNIDRGGLSAGFDYNIKLSVIKLCSGNFNAELYNGAYSKIQKQINSAKDETEKKYYNKMLEKLEDYVKQYNAKYQSYVVGVTTDTTPPDFSGELVIYKDNVATERYNFDKKMLDKKIEKKKIENTCTEVASVSNIVVDLKNIGKCISDCMGNNSTSSSCHDNCGMDSKCHSNCENNAASSCSKNCNNIKVEEVSSANSGKNCPSGEDLTVTLKDGNTVSPFTVEILERYELTAPKTYLDNSGKVVKRIYNNEVDENNEMYLDGGHRFYIDNVEEDSDYKATTIISYLGENKKSSIKNENCQFEIISVQTEAYRIINTKNPFINDQRLGKLNNNWKNDKFDFTKIIDSDREPLFTFNISKEDIANIKVDNMKVAEAYLGTCNEKNHSEVMSKICAIINETK